MFHVCMLSSTLFIGENIALCGLPFRLDLHDGIDVLFDTYILLIPICYLSMPMPSRMVSNITHV